MHSFETDFYFLGERTYVHGPTILGSFLNTMEALERANADSETLILTCRFQRYTRENGIILCWTAEEERPRFCTSHLCATATMKSRNLMYNFALLCREGRPIARRMPYDEENYFEEIESDSEFGGRASLRNIATKKDLIRAIVAFNKRVHLKTEGRKASKQSSRWSFSWLRGLALPRFPAETSCSDMTAKASLLLTSMNVWIVRNNFHSVSEGYLEFAEYPPCAFRIGFAGQPY